MCQFSLFLNSLAKSRTDWGDARSTCNAWTMVDSTLTLRITSLAAASVRALLRPTMYNLAPANMLHQRPKVFDHTHKLSYMYMYYMCRLLIEKVELATVDVVTSSGKIFAASFTETTVCSGDNDNFAFKTKFLPSYLTVNASKCLTRSGWIVDYESLPRL